MTSGETNYSFLDSLLRCFCCLDDDSGNLNEEEEDFLELNIGNELATTLIQEFSHTQQTFPSNFQPIISIPNSLGIELYNAVVKSIERQKEIAQGLIREDEAFARELQEALDIESQRDTQAPALELPEIPGDENDLAIADQSAQYFREKAQDHFKRRKELYRLAKACLQDGDKRQANYLFQQAKQQTQLFERANQSAAAAFLAENDLKNPFKHCIDLHKLFVKEAIVALDVFLDQEISSLREEDGECRDLRVITGKGKHSLNGVARLKPAVEERLKQRDLSFVEINPGCLKTRIFIDSKLVDH